MEKAPSTIASTSSSTLKSSLSTTLNTDSKPHSFSIAALHADDFDPQSFVAERRQHAPLSLLRDELRSYASSLSSQIVHALQKDFNLFLNFGPSLADATLLAKSLAPALVKLRTQLDELHTHLQSQADALHAALSRRHEIHNRRVALQTLVAVNDSLLKCERLLRQYSSLASDPLAQHALALLERITAETAQLTFTLSRAQTSAFLDALSVRVSAVKRQVRASLDQCLQHALPYPKSFDSDVLARVLSLYVVAGMHDDAHEFFMRQVVSPFTTQRLRMGAMLAAAERSAQQTKSLSGTNGTTANTTSGSSNGGSAGTSVTPGDALRAAHDEIVAFLGDRVLPVVSLCQSDPRLARRLDFVGRSVWPQLQRAISSNMAPAFSPGIPDVFHRSFRAGVDIFAAVEAAAGDEFRLSLRTSATTAEFWRHWNLPVYFQLRFQEISSAFEKCLQDGPVALSEGNNLGLPHGGAIDLRLLRTDVYLAAATAALVTCLRRCWADEVFLSALTHRFVRLSLQLIARYATWVRTGLAGEWTGGDGVARGAARIVHDVGILQTRLPAELASVLRARCPSLQGDTVEAIENGFSDAVDRFSGLVPDIIRSIADTLGQTCSENLQPLRGIIATYRMSSKQAPTRYSSFVPKILRPLRVFLKDHEQVIQPDVGMDIAKHVIQQTCKEYSVMATDLIERNKNNEATLRRLNIGRGNSTAKGNGGMSVVEKIATQLYLDVEQFSEEVSLIGIHVDKVDTLQELRDNVKRERDVSIEDGIAPAGEGSGGHSQERAML